MAIDDYVKSLMEAAGLTDEAQKKTYEQFFQNPAVRTKLESTYRESTEGIERERGRYQTEKQRADEAKQAAQAYYQQSLEKWGEYDKAASQANAQVQAYVNLYGELPGGGNPNNPQAVQQATKDMIDRKTFDEYRKQTESTMIGLTKVAAEITASSITEYGKAPDLDAILKIAQEKNYNAKQAYDEWSAPMRQEKQKAADDARINQMVEARLVEERSRQQARATTDPQMSEFRANMAKRTDQPVTARDSFMQGWRDQDPAAALAKEFPKH